MKYKALYLVVVIVAIIAVGYAHVGTKINRVSSVTPPVVISKEQPFEAAQRATFPVSIVDALGNTVQIPSVPKRIVSLAPSITELLFDLGAGDRVVADTTACDWPERAKALPHIGGYGDMSVEGIAALNPDLILADITINAKIIRLLEAKGLPVVAVDPKDLDTSYAAIRTIGRATGQTTEGAAQINSLRSSFEQIEKTVSAAIVRPKVLIAYDVPKIYTSGPGTLIDDMVRLAGGQNIAKSNDALDPEVVILQQPDVIICDPDLEPRLANMPGWKDSVPAIQNSIFFHTSRKATLIRATSRLAAGAHELATFLHPELFTANGKPAQWTNSSKRLAP